jgi:uncharacterized protein (TIGR02646 family)
MIRVHKPTPAPAVLLTRGVAATQALVATYDSTPEDYSTGAKTFNDFERSIYAADEVKNALRSAQHDKCAFCESKITHISYGDVEHYRPKAGYKQRDAEALRQPGYYWLAYEWANLFFCCQLCNQRFKRNLFPLKDGRRRARPHKRDHSKEEPLLIDPSAQDPARYLEFRTHYVHAVGGCREGATTIEVLGLNREELAEKRADYLRQIRQLVQARDRIRSAADAAPAPGDDAILRELDDAIRACTDDSSEYAAMIRAFLAASLA